MQSAYDYIASEILQAFQINHLTSKLLFFWLRKVKGSTMNLINLLCQY